MEAAFEANDMHIENVPNVVGACCMLHNICEIHNDTFNEEWLQNMNEDGADTIAASSSSVGSCNDIRDALIAGISPIIPFNNNMHSVKQCCEILLILSS